MAGERKYSRRTAAETLEWINAIIDFIKPYRFFLDAHVVNFFTDKLWESVDKEWIDCLQTESVENLLLIPSGVVQDHRPASLKEYVLTLKSLAFFREQADLKKVIYAPSQVLPDLHMTALNTVLTQGMNQKKKHEIEALSAVVSSIARNVGVNTIIDVGAGQGYLAQVLCFQHQLPVIAVDACSHHGSITNARTERMKKHYAAKMRKSRYAVSLLRFIPNCPTFLFDICDDIRSEDRVLTMPKTVTCRVLSTDTLKALSKSLLENDDVEQTNIIEKGICEHCHGPSERVAYSDCLPSLLLAGLHACGDLSVTMLRTFLESPEVKAVVSIGCCYNLLSEEEVKDNDSQYGFPVSNGVKSTGLSLGKSSRDLACQSAERWRELDKDAGVHNFELHAFRAAFQMVLFRYYPESLARSPAIGRQGKALRHKHYPGIVGHREETAHNPPPLSSQNCKMESTWPNMNGTGKSRGFDLESDAMCDEASSNLIKGGNKYSLFEKFSHSGLDRLGLHHCQDTNLTGVWKETEPFAELIGPYWSLRAALGPVLETIILLDRLLFLQEQGNLLEAIMIPIFYPTLSPRNVALIAKKF
ncbi:hypothetical protein RJ639_000835 [Escallonia herrerae]|uniref:Methyltransferase domain-containing protein n=1 Tax=Escallonia herrerae TaxID=1293975 RepID=A0AA89BIQ5_9ASTE|nr:hypothetical protein RJ639_000835 [Escallonia herrerae]